MNTENKENQDNNHNIDPFTKRFICSSTDPMPDNCDDSKWVHPDSIELDQYDGYPSGDIVEYECPHCKITFKVELPQ